MHPTSRKNLNASKTSSTSGSMRPCSTIRLRSSNLLLCFRILIRIVIKMILMILLPKRVTVETAATASITLLSLEWIVDTNQIQDLMKVMMTMGMKAPQSGGKVVANTRVFNGSQETSENLKCK
jgi:hypothetical protein